MSEIQGFRSEQKDINFDGKAQRTSLNTYKKMKHAFAITNEKSKVIEHFEAGDYIMGNGLFVWGVKEEYFEENYKIVEE